MLHLTNVHKNRLPYHSLNTSVHRLLQEQTVLNTASPSPAHPHYLHQQLKLLPWHPSIGCSVLLLFLGWGYSLKEGRWCLDLCWSGNNPRGCNSKDTWKLNNCCLIGWLSSLSLSLTCIYTHTKLCNCKQWQSAFYIWRPESLKSVKWQSNSRIQLQHHNQPAQDFRRTNKHNKGAGIVPWSLALWSSVQRTICPSSAEMNPRSRNTSYKYPDTFTAAPPNSNQSPIPELSHQPTEGRKYCYSQMKAFIHLRNPEKPRSVS